MLKYTYIYLVLSAKIVEVILSNTERPFSLSLSLSLTLSFSFSHLMLEYRFLQFLLHIQDLLLQALRYFHVFWQVVQHVKMFRLR